MQCASCVLMVRPAAFGFNEETAVNNYFQQASSASDISELAKKEFDNMVALLKENQIEVIVIEDTDLPPKPDAIFPNNWFTCKNGLLTLFPMYASSRRSERRAAITDIIKSKAGIKEVADLTAYENSDRFLEGTGSMICDHEHKIIYACISARTDKDLVKQYADHIGYKTILFIANDAEGRNIYHTNVMMCIGENFAIICTDSIDEKQRDEVVFQLQSTGHEIISITPEQVNSFAGNMLQLINKSGKPFLLMSNTAYKSLQSSQINAIKKYAEPLIADIPTIEKTGGGSVRCMVAEIA